MENLKSKTRYIKIIRFGLVALISLNLLWLNAAHSQSYTPVRNIGEFKNLYAVKSASINTLRSDFVQEKSISMLQNKLTSQGSFIFKKTNKLRMEYTKPFVYVFIMDNDNIVIKNDTQKSTVSVSSNKLFKMISQITIDCVTGNVLNSKDFDITYSENASVYHLNLFPKQKMLKSLFREIDLLISKSDFTVDKLELKEISGDSTIITFSNKRINTAVSDEVFKVN